ncbi:MAG: mrdA, partial [Mucilaginibacter sp.]|nr:mrdA [Mucilaginibacter sp.]
VAFAPRENPKIAIAVIVENAGQGARWAAPIASFMIEKYLRDTITRRPSGIDPEYFMNANLLPAIITKAPPVKKISPDSLKKAAELDSLKKLKLKSASTPNKKASVLKEAALLPKRKEDE